MKNQQMESRLNDDIRLFISQCQTLCLATASEDGELCSSYAPFSYDDKGFYILVTDIAQHGKNLKNSESAAVLIVEDEVKSQQIFARVRVTYSVKVSAVVPNSSEWRQAINDLSFRHGEMIKSLSELSDFTLYSLKPTSGRFVKGFAKAYELSGEGLFKNKIEHLKDGHVRRDSHSSSSINNHVA